MAVLLANHLRYDFDDPDDPRNDHLIFSKGHASPLLYSMYKAAGAITDEELLTFRRFGSRLEGHPTPDPPVGRRGDRLARPGSAVRRRASRSPASAWTGCPYRVWVLCGDSEMAEGSMWEAFEHAGDEKLDNLTAIIDVNRLGQRGETMHGWDLDSYAKRARGVRLARDRDRRARRRGDRPRVRRGRGDHGHADRDRRADDQGQGRQGGRGQGGLARQGARRSRGGDRRSSAAIRNITVDVAKPEAGRAASAFGRRSGSSCRATRSAATRSRRGRRTATR